MKNFEEETKLIVHESIRLIRKKFSSITFNNLEDKISCYLSMACIIYGEMIVEIIENTGKD